MPTVVKLDDVTVRLGGRAVLQKVTLGIEQGERVVLVGPSGAGKSTLLAVLNGTVVPEHGDVWILGENVARLSAPSRRSLYSRVGTIYQDLCLVDSLRVVHNVNAGNLGQWTTLRSLVSLLWPLERERVHHALERVGIAEKMYERTSTLSGGQQQRVAIARVLVQNPEIILADEPISSLDPERSKEAMNLLCNLGRELNKTVVISGHSIEFARTHFDRVIGVKNGTICFDCPPSALSGSRLEALYGGHSTTAEVRAGPISAQVSL